MASEESQPHYVERSESFLDTPDFTRLTVQKSSSQSSFSVTQAVFGDGVDASASPKQELARSVSSENQRAEVNVEIQGFRETCFSPAEKVVSTRVRSVYSRSSSGGTSGVDVDHVDITGTNAAEFDSAFAETSDGGSGVESVRRERTTSDSYYIKQTYQISSSENTSLSVTAIQNVTFKSSKDVEIGGATSTDHTAHALDGSQNLDSPKSMHAHVDWFDTSRDADQGLDILKSAREDVQQLIQSSYMVSDISSVVDNDSMGPNSVRAKTQESTIAEVSPQGTSVDTVSVGMDFNQNSAVRPPGDLALKLESTDKYSTDKIFPPRLTYSPGIAIRSYALEELADKKSRSTPERIEASGLESAVRSTRFDEDSSQVDVDMGRSVDEPPPSGDAIPHLKKVDLTQFKNRQVDQSSRTITTETVNMFTLTKVQKVSLTDESHIVESNSKGQITQETDKGEEDELLDQLVDLESIQVGYRFHDVGMMQDTGGICNMAFDDSEHVVVDAVQQDHISHSLPSRTHSTVELSNGQALLTSATETAGLQSRTDVQEMSGSTESSANYLISGSSSVTTSSKFSSSSLQSSDKHSIVHLEAKSNDIPSSETLNKTKLQRKAKTKKNISDLKKKSQKADTRLPDASISTPVSTKKSENSSLNKEVKDVTVSIDPASHSFIESLTKAVSAEVEKVVRSEDGSKRTSDSHDGAKASGGVSKATENATATVLSAQASLKKSKDYPPGTAQIESGNSLDKKWSQTECKEEKGVTSTQATVNIAQAGLSSAVLSGSSLSVAKEATNQLNAQKQASEIKTTQLMLATEAKGGRPMQVTRRFNVSKKFESSLRSLGGVLRSESVYIDVYFDTSDFELTLADCWLRTRNGRWQLHANFSKLLNEGTKQEYYETEEPGSILAALGRILKTSKNQQAKGESSSVALFAVRFGLREFVRYRTTRKTYTLQELTVDLDLPEYGFWVGSVTSTGNGCHKPCDALNKIYNFWNKTGVQALNLLRD